MSELKAYRFLSTDEVWRDATLGTDYYIKSEADAVLAKKDKEIEELKRQVAFLKTTHDSCGHCNNCAEGMGKILDENLDELKVKLAEKDKEIAVLKNVNHGLELCNSKLQEQVTLLQAEFKKDPGDGKG